MKPNHRYFGSLGVRGAITLLPGVNQVISTFANRVAARGFCEPDFQATPRSPASHQSAAAGVIAT